MFSLFIRDPITCQSRIKLQNKWGIFDLANEFHSLYCSLVRHVSVVTVLPVGSVANDLGSSVGQLTGNMKRFLWVPFQLKIKIFSILTLDILRVSRLHRCWLCDRNCSSSQHRSQHSWNRKAFLAREPVQLNLIDLKLSFDRSLQCNMSQFALLFSSPRRMAALMAEVLVLVLVQGRERVRGLA